MLSIKLLSLDFHPHKGMYVNGSVCVIHKAEVIKGGNLFQVYFLESETFKIFALTKNDVVCLRSKVESFKDVVLKVSAFIDSDAKDAVLDVFPICEPSLA